MRVDLAHPVMAAGNHVMFVEVRPPGHAVFDHFNSLADPTRDDLTRLASRLTGVSEATIRKFHPSDFDRLKDAIKSQIENARRRLSTRSAIAKRKN